MRLRHFMLYFLCTVMQCFSLVRPLFPNEEAREREKKCLSGLNRV